MILLYHAGGAGDFELGSARLPAADERRLIGNVARVLRTRGEVKAADELQAIPFEIFSGDNRFGDDFAVLSATVPLSSYERLRLEDQSGIAKPAFRAIAQALGEFGPYIRFISVDLALEPIIDISEADRARALTETEIRAVVYRYIGVSGGYLGDFTYQSHFEFYVDLGLPIDPSQYDGTTRVRFERILREQPPQIQARILEGVLTRFPRGSSELRTEDRASKIKAWIAKLRQPSAVLTPSPRITSAIVERALQDAEHLITASGPSSGVDRVHTALHGYLRAVCDTEGIQYPAAATIGALLTHIRDGHPRFTSPGPRADDIRQILRAMAAIADVLNPLRNQASVAHPNANILDPAEAMLVVNTVRTLLHYVDHRVSG